MKQALGPSTATLVARIRHNFPRRTAHPRKTHFGQTHSTFGVHRILGGVQTEKSVCPREISVAGASHAGARGMWRGRRRARRGNKKMKREQRSLPLWTEAKFCKNRNRPRVSRARPARDPRARRSRVRARGAAQNRSQKRLFCRVEKQGSWVRGKRRASRSLTPATR